MAWARSEQRECYVVGHDVVVSDAGTVTAAAEQPVRRYGWIGLLAAWFGVASVELVDLPNAALPLFVIPPFEFAVWLTALALTVRLACRARAGAPIALATAVLLAVCRRRLVVRPTRRLTTQLRT